MSREFSGMAIASLVMGLCSFVTVGMVTPILAVIFGFVGLSNIKRKKLRGKAMAIWGIVLGLLWTAGLLVLILLAALGVFNGLLPPTA